MTPLHRDHLHEGNFAQHVIGRKQWGLLPPWTHAHVCIEKNDTNHVTHAHLALSLSPPHTHPLTYPFAHTHTHTPCPLLQVGFSRVRHVDRPDWWRETCPGFEVGGEEGMTSS